MFNEEEFPIFYKTKLNPVFFGEAIAGANLPCLTYMITFKNMEERDKNWAAFGADADWKKVSADVKYANTVSNIRRVFRSHFSTHRFNKNLDSPSLAEIFNAKKQVKISTSTGS